MTPTWCICSTHRACFIIRRRSNFFPPLHWSICGMNILVGCTCGVRVLLRFSMTECGQTCKHTRCGVRVHTTHPSRHPQQAAVCSSHRALRWRCWNSLWQLWEDMPTSILPAHAETESVTKPLLSVQLVPSAFYLPPTCTRGSRVVVHYPLPPISTCVNWTNTFLTIPCHLTPIINSCSDLVDST